MTLELRAVGAGRYLLGRQGLWPGRRWAGADGAAEALRALESVQVDPMTVVARSHDLVLWSRVEAYEPRQLDGLLHRDRRFFEYGGHLDIYPMEELPYWAPHVRRRATEGRWAAFGSEHRALVDRVREIVRERGPLASRDLDGEPTPAGSYRSRKDTGLALYHLWITGELMTAGRRGFERLYDLRERVAPPEFQGEADEQEAAKYFEPKALRYHGLGTARDWAGTVGYYLGRRLDKVEAQRRLQALVTSGEATVVTVAGVRESYYAPASDLPLLEAVAADEVPDVWRPLGPTTSEEVNLLSPLDNLLARERTKALFGFEYVWEVYKPAEARRWGRYTMPVLYRDRLVARLEPRLDRKAGVLLVEGFWPEDEALGKDLGFASALDRGLARFAAFNGAERVDNVA